MEFSPILFSTMFLWLTSPTSWAYILGVILSLVYSGKYREPCMFLLLGSVLTLITLFITNFGMAYLPVYLVDQGYTTLDLSLRLRAFGWFMGLFHLGGFVLILLAVFSARKKPAIHA